MDQAKLCSFREIELWVQHLFLSQERSQPQGVYNKLLLSHRFGDGVNGNKHMIVYKKLSLSKIDPASAQNFYQRPLPAPLQKSGSTGALEIGTKSGMLTSYPEIGQAVLGLAPLVTLMKLTTFC